MQRNNKVIRVGVFDQIVSAGGVHRFTIKLLEECAKVGGDKWKFHLMWPLFDSSNNVLAQPHIERMGFERIAVHEQAASHNRFVPLVRQVANASRRWRWWPRNFKVALEHRVAKYEQQARREEQSILRLGNGAGLQWLDCRIQSFDLIYLPYPYLTFPGTHEWRPAVPLVITLHDLAHEHTDAWGDLTEVLKWEAREWTRRADLVIFSSDYIKLEAQRIYNLPEERTTRIYLGPTEVKEVSATKIDVLRKYNLKPGYVFTLGWSAKHKRVDAVIEGFAMFKKQSGASSGVPLVIAGPKTEQLLAASNMHDLEVNRDIFALGFVPDEDVPALYRNSSIVVTASTSEAGLNAMIFDAIYYGKDVACSNIPQFIERLGTRDELALTFDPNVPASLARALACHFADPVEANRRIGNAQSVIGSRSWSQIATDYLSAFESVL